MCFRLLSEYHFFLFEKHSRICRLIRPVSVSSQSIISSYLDNYNDVKTFLKVSVSSQSIISSYPKMMTHYGCILQVSVSSQSIISSYFEKNGTKVNYTERFRLLSEYHFFLFNSYNLLYHSIIILVSVSSQSIISSYLPSTNPLFYHILFYHFRENSKNLYISLS